MKKIEGKTIEFKEKVTTGFLKTVSAFSNYGDGTIIFGVADDGKVIGINDLKQAAIDIENKINDSISPIPKYDISVDSGKGLITLSVKEGKSKPYFYKSKAYARNDASTIPVDRTELIRLILEGENKDYESLPASNQKLSFEILENHLVKELGVDRLDDNIKRTLSLLTDEGYNIAAELVADENNFRGLDIVRFGSNDNEFRDREIYEKCSIIKMVNAAMPMFERYYIMEKVQGFKRIPIQMIPREAFREALANALLHRQWDVNSAVQVSMYDDRIEIQSPGGLPAGMTREDYEADKFSKLSNPIITEIFYKLHYIEKFGTGITRIKEAYEDSVVKPSFKITDNRITIILPSMVFTEELSEDENAVLKYIPSSGSVSRGDIQHQSGFSKAKTVRMINRLIEMNAITAEGNNKATKYKRK